MGEKTAGSPFAKLNFAVLAWGLFLTFSLASYYLFSDGDFSFVMTYASMTRCFAFCVLAWKMRKTAQGVSLKTLEMYAIMYAFRLLSIVRHQGYLPYDRSGDWFYHVIEFAALFLCCLCMFFIMKPHKETYDKSFDKFGDLHIPSELGILYLVLPCFALAILVHPNLNAEFLSDFCWTFSMYLETVAIIPQLYMFQKQASRIVEVLISHFVFALGFARILDMVFWMSSYHELGDKAGSNYGGMIVLLSQFVHVALMGDFFYYYFLSLKRGTAMQLPTTQAGLV
mmetsp:Transcript_19996/g.28908  ORF Transcript_19996/g.28908 Transcript_19996/m.28908 type:complete len:283 (-) Transcript_19996:120-968(-)|eukprot:CAMPEP_0113936006 /NCGR_PEP_ID=MMETSP1339-20121228/3005_1 /TAXON_ID=94617 /ORGANISM="Fibrocapsa japonica" /LENGTH=282 /DNA_ID=CAMNT_0000938321 /DNA_START=72 /DNA_END=920 /DNA_ORIENTATION=- /assembly_acc=CAM_ASM_000762